MVKAGIKLLASYYILGKFVLHYWQGITLLAGITLLVVTGVKKKKISSMPLIFLATQVIGNFNHNYKV